MMKAMTVSLFPCPFSREGRSFVSRIRDFHIKRTQWVMQLRESWQQREAASATPHQKLLHRMFFPFA
jgi:hypothetical protein